MKWLGRWLTKQIRHSQDEGCVLASGSLGTVAAMENNWTENLNIGITTASGGKIVTFRRYDRKTDRNDNRVYVIPEDMDFNHELGKLITLESMRG